MNYFNQIEKEKLNPIYIYIYRDGRDVDLSFKKTIIGPKHSYFTAKKWLNDQIICEKIKTNVNAFNRLKNVFLSNKRIDF